MSQRGNNFAMPIEKFSTLVKPEDPMQGSLCAVHSLPETARAMQGRQNDFHDVCIPVGLAGMSPKPRIPLISMRQAAAVACQGEDR